MVKTVVSFLLSAVSVLGIAQQPCFEKVFINYSDLPDYHGKQIFSIDGRMVSHTRLVPGVYLIKEDCEFKSIDSDEYAPVNETTDNEEDIDTFPIPPSRLPFIQERWKFPLTDSRSVSCPKGQPVHDFIDTIITSLKISRGKIATDSCNSLEKHFHALAKAGNFLTEAQSGQFIPDTTSYLTWLTKTLATAQNTADSIDNICKWIMSNYPYGDYDPRSDYLRPDSIYQNVVSGTMFGQCGDYVSFLAKIAARFPSWGTPIQFFSCVDSVISLGGKQPAHVFLGFLKGKVIWCVADPTLGGVVRNNTQRVMNLKDIQKSLKSRQNSWKVQVTGAESSIQEGWTSCVPKVLLRDTTSLFSYTTPQGRDLVRGHWSSFQYPERVINNVDVPYWKAKGYPRMTWLNIYCEIVGKL